MDATRAAPVSVPPPNAVRARRGAKLMGVVLSVVLAGGVGVTPASAATGRCSESGDTCLSTFKRGGVRYIRYSMVERYVSRARLCVRAPGGTTTCRTFRVRRMGQVWGVTARWSSHFPRRGAGVYRVGSAPFAVASSVSFRVR